MPAKGTKIKSGVKPVGAVSKVSKATVLTCLRAGKTFQEIAAEYDWNVITPYRWVRTDSAFRKAYEEITGDPRFNRLRATANKGPDFIKNEDKPKWTTAFLDSYQETGEKIKSCRAAGASLEMLEDALNPDHPSYEPWFLERFSKIEKEHRQELLDKARVQAKSGNNTAMLRWIMETEFGGPKAEDDDTGMIDDSDLHAILRQLSGGSEPVVVAVQKINGTELEIVDAAGLLTEEPDAVS